MPYRITITRVASEHLQSLTARERSTLGEAVSSRLVHQPDSPSRSIKRLRPNPLAGWELRVGDLRVLYNVEGDEVILLVIGRKAGNALVVSGEVFRGHQDDPAPDPPSGPGEGAD
jgi:mRNA-degrading endonuclease RelE of RelBE toxin-antitoxin system